MFGEKSDDLTGVFNSCWVFGRAKCGVYKHRLSANIHGDVHPA